MQLLLISFIHWAMWALYLLVATHLSLPPSFKNSCPLGVKGRMSASLGTAWGTSSMHTPLTMEWSLRCSLDLSNCIYKNHVWWYGIVLPLNSNTSSTVMVYPEITVATFWQSCLAQYNTTSTLYLVVLLFDIHNLFWMIFFPGSSTVLPLFTTAISKSLLHSHVMVSVR